LRTPRLLIKLGGTLLDAAESRDRLAREIARVAETAAVVVVHGGGKQMTRYLAERGIESRFVNGLRVTTPEVLDAVVKVFAGSVNTELVAAFRAAGAKPVGLTGLDAGLVDAEPVSAELGHVGRPVRSNGNVLDALTREDFLPVVACVAGDSQGAIYNVNADQMAVACANGFGSRRLIFLTDVEGARDGAGEIRATLTADEAAGLIREGVATGGMQAKLEAAISALKQGLKEVIIAPGARVGIVGSLIAGEQIGTRVVP
jgi:acetylglutamate kinase